MVSPRFGEQKTCLGNSQTACEFPKLLVIFIIAVSNFSLHPFSGK